MQYMLRSKWFWVGAAFIVPFIVVWIAGSLLHAIVAYAVFGGMFFFFKIQMDQKRRRRDEEDVYIYYEEPREGRIEPRVRKPKKEIKLIKADRKQRDKIRRRGF